MHRRIVKVIPERIYSMVVHPDSTRDLVSLEEHLDTAEVAKLISPLPRPAQVFAGDKSGYISLWDCTDAGRPVEPKAGTPKNPVGDDGEEGEGEAEVETSYGRWWNWKAHRSNSVSLLKFRPGQPGSVSHARGRANSECG